ncbi:MAG: hypothetical protein RBG1_1C00001G0487 [candidate division Zixibacteria bacterium RBG-1]|nr:MAG: hypothetical protein RBG1_1C00001G0487 [candidate division Zixibacteria bacterium RBG-1]OGC83472.1 MAG: hypothetical protein A2V73_01870 [candidate division Zixibacteria bacterium RBG_19FT_COMBO_42_43]
MRIAVIDLGTNTVLLTLAEIQKNRAIKSLLEAKETPRLGENVDKTKKISSASIRRVLKTIQDFQEKALKLKAEKIILMGTAALRGAKNTSYFKKLIQNKTGLKLEVISGKKEAELAFCGAIADFKHGSKKFTSLDIGGGSTEVIVGTQKKILKLKSLNLGSLRFTERFLKNEKDGYFKTLEFINQKFSELKKNFRLKNSLLIGSGGTITTLGALSLNLKKYERDKIHGLVLPIPKINYLLEKLSNMSLAQRRRFMKIDPQRADIIIAGTAILQQFMEQFGFTDIIISDKSLRWGVLEQIRAEL